MIKSKHADRGKWAEGQVRDWLDESSRQAHDFAWHRFPDAKAARGALAAQPSDTLVVSAGETTFLEIKETKELKRLPRAKVSQYGALRKFHWAGARVIVLVFRSAYNDWLIFEARHLFPHDEAVTPTSFPFLNYPTFPTAAAALQEIFK